MAAAVGVLRAAHRLRARFGDLDAECADALRRAAIAAAAAPHTDAQRTAGARALSSSAGGLERPLVPRAAAAADGVLLSAQRLLLSELTHPVRVAMRALNTKAMRDVFRSAPSGGAVSQGHVDDEAHLSAAMLAFAASPQPYITQVGVYLLSLPQLLMPFTAGGALSHIHTELCPAATAARELAARPGGTEADADAGADAAISWLHCVADVTARLLLESVRFGPAFSPLGAKQLAADVAYLANVFGSAGLALPPNAALDELHRLLTCGASELATAVRATTALPRDLATAVASKRGTHGI